MGAYLPVIIIKQFYNSYYYTIVIERHGESPLMCVHACNGVCMYCMFVVCLINMQIPQQYFICLLNSVLFLSFSRESFAYAIDKCEFENG